MCGTWHCKYNNKLSHVTFSGYCKHGKVYWAKHLWIQPYEISHGNTFVHGVYYLTIAKYSWENLRSTLKNLKNRKRLAQHVFPCLWYVTAKCFPLDTFHVLYS